MPYKMIIPQEPALNLPYVEAIAQELRLKQPEGSPDLPFIIEEEHRHSDRIHVTVIWNRWAQIGLEERSHIIFEAYESARPRRVAYPHQGACPHSRQCEETWRRKRRF